MIVAVGARDAAHRIWGQHPGGVRDGALAGWRWGGDDAHGELGRCPRGLVTVPTRQRAAPHPVVPSPAPGVGHTPGTGVAPRSASPRAGSGPAGHPHVGGPCPCAPRGMCGTGEDGGRTPLWGRSRSRCGAGDGGVHWEPGGITGEGAEGRPPEPPDPPVPPHPLPSSPCCQPPLFPPGLHVPSCPGLKRLCRPPTPARRPAARPWDPRGVQPGRPHPAAPWVPPPWAAQAVR